jgi:hypothetical protein
MGQEDDECLKILASIIGAAGADTLAGAALIASLLLESQIQLRTHAELLGGRSDLRAGTSDAGGGGVARAAAFTTT